MVKAVRRGERQAAVVLRSPSAARARREGLLDVVNRGVAAWKGRSTSAPSTAGWWRSTRARQAGVERGHRRRQELTITGAAARREGTLIIGIAAASTGPRLPLRVRRRTGKLAWRFYTVPGDPSKPFENPRWRWRYEDLERRVVELGGGGTTWDADLLRPRSQSSSTSVPATASNGRAILPHREQGRQLFTSRSSALTPTPGNYVWHYQATPGEEWDFDAVQQLTLADLKIDGQAAQGHHAGEQERILLRPRPQDRQADLGHGLRAVNWASGVDPKTGRPIENPGIRYDLTGSRST